MRYVSHWTQAEKQLDRAIIQRIMRVGFSVEARAKANTPVLTGNARRSLHTIAMDEHGSRVDGGSTDGNGKPTPQYPATGRITVIVGSNCGYFKWIEIGSQGRAGKAPLGSAFSGVGADVAREFRGMVA